MEPIYLSPTLRVVDYDSHQYVIERKGLNKAGEVVWRRISYVSKVPALVRCCREWVAADAAIAARTVAQSAFDAGDLPATLAELPPKDGK